MKRRAASIGGVGSVVILSAAVVAGSARAQNRFGLTSTPLNYGSSAIDNYYDAHVLSDGTVRLGPFFDEDLLGERPMFREEALKSSKNLGAIDLDQLIPKPDIPPAPKRLGVLTTLPKSFHPPIPAVKTKYDGIGMDVQIVPVHTQPTTIIPNSYIADHTPDAVGAIEEIELAEKTASLGQNVVVRLRRAAQMGERLNVVLPKGNVQDAVRGAVGPILEVGGTVEIVKVLNADKNVYLANVTMDLNPITIGSLLIENKLPRVSMSASGTRVNVASRIIGGEFDSARSMVGQDAVIYLDSGENVGWKVGDVVAIRSLRSAHRSDTKFPDWYRVIGLAKIVEVESTVSTGIVIQATEEIAIGDSTGGEEGIMSQDIREENPDTTAQSDEL